MTKFNRDEKGFTLIELMIVIAIIGILAAIAIPQFSAYRTRSYNSVAQSDLRNAATAQEAYVIDNNTYCSTAATLSNGDYGFFNSADITFEIDAADLTSYTMTAIHDSSTQSYIIVGPGGTIAEE